MPAVAGKQPLGRLASQSKPIAAEFVEQLLAKHDIAIPVTLAAVDVNHHAAAVDVADLQMGHFGSPGSGAVHGHQQDAIERQLGCIDQLCHFLRGENLRKVNHLLRVRCLGNTPAFLQHLDIEEAQRRQPQCYRVGAVLQFAEQHRLVMADVLGAKLVGTAMEVPAEMLHAMNVGADGGLGEVAALQLLNHELA